MDDSISSFIDFAGCGQMVLRRSDVCHCTMIIFFSSPIDLKKIQTGRLCFVAYQNIDDES